MGRADQAGQFRQEWGREIACVQLFTLASGILPVQHHLLTLIHFLPLFHSIPFQTLYVVVCDFGMVVK